MAIVAAAVDHRPMRSPLRPVLAVLLGLVSVALLASGALALGSALFDRTETRSHVLRGAVSRVVVDGASGDVVLSSGPAGLATVRERRHFWLRAPKLALSLRDGVLSVRVHCGSFGPDCSDDLEITAPPGVARTDVDVDSGDVTLSAFDSRRISASADSGDVRLDGVFRDDLAARRIDAHSDSGDVTVRGH